MLDEASRPELPPTLVGGVSGSGSRSGSLSRQGSSGSRILQLVRSRTGSSREIVQLAREMTASSYASLDETAGAQGGGAGCQLSCELGGGVGAAAGGEALAIDHARALRHHDVELLPMAEGEIE